MSETRENGKKATQPCHCGFHGDPTNDCHCSSEQIQRYIGKISGPLLDRIDLHVEVPRPKMSILDRSGPAPESSRIVAERVAAARKIQLNRQGCCNALLTHEGLDRYCALEPKVRTLMEQASAKLRLSPRAIHRVLKVARTLADLEASENIAERHMAESIACRNKGSGH